MDELSPIYRVEFFLDKIVNSGENPYDPIYRIEKYLAKIAGEDVEVPTPIYRVEMYLAYLCGMDVTIPDPIYRIEFYLAKKCGMEVETPVPIYRIEYWLAEWAEQSGGQLVTVTGVSPIALANALAHSIKSLTQYGKCVQDGTPTPSAPVDIVCNNGALRMVDDELPAAYKRVLGFTCDNNAMWEITGFKLRGADTVRISFAVTAACNVFGCYQGADATDNYDLYVSTTSGSKYFRYGNGTYLSYWSSSNLGQRFDVVYTPTGSQGMPQDSTWTPKTFTSANDLLIGSTTTGGTSAKLKGNLYGDFIVDGRLHLIPCERVSDGVLGYYDTYGETFYEPYTDFDGAVSLGYDGSHYHREVVGTSEVLNVYGNVYDNATMGTTYNVTLNSVVSDHTIKSGSATSIKLPCKPNTNYTIGFIKPPSSGNIFRVGTAATDDVPTSSSPVAAINGIVSTNYDPITINSGENATTMWVQIGSTVQASFADLIVQEGTSLHIQTASVVDLYSAGDNYPDEVDIISGGVTHKVGIKVLDGTEEWKASTTASVYYVAIDGMKYCNPVEKGYSSHFVGSNASNTNMPNGSCKFSYTAGGDGVVSFKYNSAPTIDEWKAWLAEQYAEGNPVIVIYPLDNPATEQTTPHSLHTVKGDNVVSVTSNVDPVELEVEYMATQEGGGGGE